MQLPKAWIFANSKFQKSIQRPNLAINFKPWGLWCRKTITQSSSFLVWNRRPTVFAITVITSMPQSSCGATHKAGIRGFCFCLGFKNRNGVIRQRIRSKHLMKRFDTKKQFSSKAWLHQNARCSSLLDKFFVENIAGKQVQMMILIIPIIP